MVNIADASMMSCDPVIFRKWDVEDVVQVSEDHHVGIEET